MALIDEIENFFDTRDLYEVINVDKNATEQQIKKAYRKASLKIHPDRVGECEKEMATKKFQVLAQVHYILSDTERRKLYDDHGIINLDGEADWKDYWRLLFPKISEKDIQKFLDSYIDSSEEEKDLIVIYNKYKGDMDKISQTHISYDEKRTTQKLNRLIDEGKIEPYSKFARESKIKKARRDRRAVKEAEEAEKLKKELMEKTGKDIDDVDDLKTLIKVKREDNYNSMIARLEAKYTKKVKKHKSDH